MGFFDKLKSGLKKTAERLTQGIGQILTPGVRLDAATLSRLEEQLILADVGVMTARRLLDDLKSILPPGSEPDAAEIRRALGQAIFRRLQPKAEMSPIPPDPLAVILVGVNGVGKTTTAGKLAALWAGEGRKVLLAAGDTFRAAAEEQLTEWAKRAKVKLVRGEHDAAPSAIVFDALQAGVSQGYDRVLVDTAGRLHTRANLMEELKKVLRSADKAAPSLPKERWLVVDAGTGQNALSQAREFDGAVGLTGLVLTKMDGTAKGGVVLGLADTIGVPIRYVGVGEGLDDLIPFDPKAFSEAIIPQG